MKVTAETIKGFTPIKVELIIESNDELLDLWHRLNMSVACVRENSECDSYHPFPKDWREVGHNFFIVINSQCRCVRSREKDE